MNCSSVCFQLVYKVSKHVLIQLIISLSRPLKRYYVKSERHVTSDLCMRQHVMTPNIRRISEYLIQSFHQRHKTLSCMHFNLQFLFVFWSSDILRQMQPC